MKHETTPRVTLAEARDQPFTTIMGPYERRIPSFTDVMSYHHAVFLHMVGAFGLDPAQRASGGDHGRR